MYLNYLNINSLRNKIIDLRQVLKHIPLTTSFLVKQNWVIVFPCVQFQISDNEIRARRDQNKYGDDLIEFVKKGLIYKRLKTFERVNSECICSELTISSKKWVYFSVYPHPHPHPPFP